MSNKVAEKTQGGIVVVGAVMIVLALTGNGPLASQFGGAVVTAAGQVMGMVPDLARKIGPAIQQGDAYDTTDDTAAPAKP